MGRLFELCPEVVDVQSFYEWSSDRVGTYKRIAATVLDAAITRPPVALMVYGHPLVLALPSQIILRIAPMLGLRAIVLPAVSALDCLMADLGVDLVSIGVQSHEATDLLLYQRPLVPEMATVLWQVGSLETRLHSTGATSRPERLRGLVDYLRRFFPDDHEVVSVCSSVVDDAPSTIRRHHLSELPRSSAELHGGVTLYLPPVPPKSRPAAEWAARLTSRTHLETIVDP